MAHLYRSFALPSWLLKLKVIEVPDSLRAVLLTNEYSVAPEETEAESWPVKVAWCLSDSLGYFSKISDPLAEEPPLIA